LTNAGITKSMHRRTLIKLDTNHPTINNYKYLNRHREINDFLYKLYLH